MGEYMGTSMTATYMTGPRLGGSGTPTFLPSISIMEPACKPYDTYPAPTPLRRSLTTLPWRPSAYYGASRLEPNVPNIGNMPEPLSDRNKLTELDSLKVPPVFAAARNALYTRYTGNDWMASNMSNFLASNRVRGASERCRRDTSTLCREVDDKTKRTQSDVTKKLCQRIGDVTFWKNEAQNEMDKMTSEIEALTKCKCCLERALAEIENLLYIAQECLYYREKRQGIDQVHDDVESGLILEVDNVKRLQEEMRRTILDATNQLALDRAALHELEKDTADKFVTLNLDGTSHQLRNSSRGIHYHDGIERVDNTYSVPETWAKFSDNNVQRSQAERHASQDMRNRIEQLLNKAANLTLYYWNKVNNAYTDKIRELVETRNHLQTHLSKVLQEIFHLDKNIELLKKSIHDKENAMMVSQTRLDTRSRRPNMESCRDHAQHRLVEEVFEIQESVDRLKAKLRESENALQHLLRTKSALEFDLSIKNNSLFIDRERCMGLRKTFPLAPRIACY